MKRRSFFCLLAAPFVARLLPGLPPDGSVGFLVPEDFSVELLALPSSFHPWRKIVSVTSEYDFAIRHPDSFVTVNDDDEIALTSDPPLPLK